MTDYTKIARFSRFSIKSWKTRILPGDIQWKMNRGMLRRIFWADFPILPPYNTWALWRDGVKGEFYGHIKYNCYYYYYYSSNLVDSTFSRREHNKNVGNISQDHVHIPKENERRDSSRESHPLKLLLSSSFYWITLPLYVRPILLSSLAQFPTLLLLLNSIV